MKLNLSLAYLLLGHIGGMTSAASSSLRGKHNNETDTDKGSDTDGAPWKETDNEEGGDTDGGPGWKGGHNIESILGLAMTEDAWTDATTDPMAVAFAYDLLVPDSEISETTEFLSGTNDFVPEEVFVPMEDFDDITETEGFPELTTELDAFTEPEVDLNKKKVNDPDDVSSVCGVDGRNKVTATNRFPYESVADLEVTTSNGKRFQCTGFFISKRVLMTAGHCIYDHSNGGYVRSVNVCPGRNGWSNPFGCTYAIRVQTVNGWSSSRSSSYDYGAIILKDDSMWKKGVGYFGFGNYATSTLSPRGVTVSGYPGDKGGREQWIDYDKFSSVSSRRLHYHTDTNGGQSGGPAWTFVNGNRRVVGIHTNGGCPNAAVRVQSSVFSFMLNCKKTYG